MKHIVAVILSVIFCLIGQNLSAAESGTKTKPFAGIINDYCRRNSRLLPRWVSAGNSACLQKRKKQDHSTNWFEEIYA